MRHEMESRFAAMQAQVQAQTLEAQAKAREAEAKAKEADAKAKEADAKIMEAEAKAREAEAKLQRVAQVLGERDEVILHTTRMLQQKEQVYQARVDHILLHEFAGHLDVGDSDSEPDEAV